MMKLLLAAVAPALLLFVPPAFAQSDEVPDGCASMVKAIGIPEISDGKEYTLLCRKGHLLAHDDSFKTPIWVVERLSPERFAGTANRDKLCNFKEDPDLPDGAGSKDSDYRSKSVQGHRSFDRGHMAPAADMKWDDEAMEQSCLLSNIAPQQGINLNRNIWADLEALVRDWACDRGDLYVVTGPIYDTVPPDTLGTSAVAVPTAFFKVAFEPQRKRAIAFILPNEQITRKGRPVATVLESFATTPSEVETRADIRLFTALSKRDRTRLLATPSPVWGVVTGCGKR